MKMNRDSAHAVPLWPVPMGKIMIQFKIPGTLKSVVAVGALLGLSGCMYGGTGYYGDGYVNNAGYQCDPYAPFDDYYACDSGYGFANIGFGGGWYDQYYYPGYGVYIFDRGGRRHAMRDTHRRHWARQRAEFGGHHARGRDRNPERHADRRDRRDLRGDATRDQRRGQYRDDRAARGDRGNRTVTRTARPDRDGQAAPTRNRDNRAERPSPRTARATDARPSVQPQSRARPAARPAQTSGPARAERPRYSERTSRIDRERLNDD